METTLTCSSGIPPSLGYSQIRIATNFETVGVFQEENWIDKADSWGKEYDMNPYTPIGYAMQSSRLGDIFSQTLDQLYIRRSTQSDFDTVANGLLTQLQQWQETLPEYLRPGCPTAPSHVRAICHLSLRYYQIIMLITRPYLLQSVLSPEPVSTSQTKYSEICEDANKESLRLVKELSTKNLISKRNYFDALYILANAMILFLRCLRNPSSDLVKAVEEILPLIKMVDHLDFAQFAIKSMHGLLKDLKLYCTNSR